MSRGDEVGLRMTVKQAKTLFLDRPAIVNQLDRVSRRRLATFGAYCMRVARNSLTPKRDLRADELPQEIKELVGLDRLLVRRDKRGRFLAGGKKAKDAELKQIVQPWPQTISDPNSPPNYRKDYTFSGKIFSRFRDLILFVLEPNMASVVIGPIIFDKSDIPGKLEYGGTMIAYRPTWFLAGENQVRAYYEKKPVQVAPRPYMRPAFDVAVDRKIPAIFREIL
jgi:hypothetical protein